MAQYIKIPNPIVAQYRNKRYNTDWFELNPIETGVNNEWVITVEAVNMLKAEVRSLSDELTQGQIDTAVTYLESLPVLEYEEITWPDWSAQI